MILRPAPWCSAVREEETNRQIFYLMCRVAVYVRFLEVSARLLVVCGGFVVVCGRFLFFYGRLWWFAVVYW